jgi:hypothetical protein
MQLWIEWLYASLNLLEDRANRNSGGVTDSGYKLS